MQLNFLQLERVLRPASLPKVLLILGEEQGLLLESLNIIRAMAQDKERLRYHIKEDGDWPLCQELLYNANLFKQQRLIEIYALTPLSMIGQKCILQYARQPNNSNIVVLVTHKLAGVNNHHLWLQDMSKLSHIIKLWPLSQHELAQWLVQRAQKLHLNLAYPAAQHLATNFSGNISGAIQELNKLSTSGYHDINLALINNLVYDQSYFNAFDLVQECCLGNSANTLKIITYLVNNASPIIMVLGAILYELRILAKMARELQQGAQVKQLCAKYRIPTMRQAAAGAFLQRHNLAKCYSFICQAATLDQLAKGKTTTHHPQALWMRVTDFCLAISQGHHA